MHMKANKLNWELHKMNSKKKKLGVKYKTVEKSNKILLYTTICLNFLHFFTHSPVFFYRNEKFKNPILLKLHKR